MNLSRLYGKNILPSCGYCLYLKRDGNDEKCGKGKPTDAGNCGAFVYEPTLREPKETPSLGHYKPEDFQI